MQNKVIVEEINDELYITLNEYNYEDSIDYAKKEQIAKLIFSFTKKVENLELKELNSWKIRLISLFNSFVLCSDFPVMDQVEEFHLNEFKGEFDFDKFPLLGMLTISWNSRMTWHGIAGKLERLVLWNYNPKSKDFNNFIDLPKIKSVELNMTNIETLKGINEMKTLESIKIMYAKNLASISGIVENDQIKRIMLDNCKKVIDVDKLSKLASLEELSINDCGDIKSLSFVKSLKKLRILRFVGTNVLDGNLSYCNGLKEVQFNYKNHYTHKPEDFH